MRRLVFVVAVGAMVCLARPAAAQSGPDEVKQLEAELNKARGQLRELEARLKKAKEKAAKKADQGTASREGRTGPGERGRMMQRGRGWGWGWGRMDPERMREMRERFRKMSQEAAKEDADRKPADPKEAKKAEGRPAGPRGFRGWYGRRGFGRDDRRPDTSDSSDLERRLDRIEQELKALRRELKQK